MRTKAMKLLLNEHATIAGSRELIRAINLLWEKDEAAYIKKCNELLDFFKIYSDDYHHYKEEQILFPALKRNIDFSQNEILVELEDHHAIFREYVKNIENSLHEKSFPNAQRQMVTYSDLLLDHIAIENDELFVLAEELFDDYQMEKMHDQFLDLDRELGEELKLKLAAIVGR